MKDIIKGKSPGAVSNLKSIIAASSLAILVLVFIIRSNYYYSSSSITPQTAKQVAKKGTPDTDCTDQTCGKIPSSLAQALIHYATSKITPQQTFGEISVSAKVLEQKSPCNFLVFGLGHDSVMWNSLNYGGRTVFLDEDEKWIKLITGRFPELESYKVTYSTKRAQSKDLMEHGLVSPACKELTDPRNSKCLLAHKELPSVVYETKWDLIMVDAPTGFHDETPGRMTAIYTAGLMARNREEGETDVFVHDVDRDVEDKFSMAFLCKGYLKKQEGRIRHFVIPSHRVGGFEKPFCPN